jgi:hypothetical protein
LHLIRTNRLPLWPLKAAAQASPHHGPPKGCRLIRELRSPARPPCAWRKTKEGAWREKAVGLGVLQESLGGGCASAQSCGFCRAAHAAWSRTKSARAASVIAAIMAYWQGTGHEGHVRTSAVLAVSVSALHPPPPRPLHQRRVGRATRARAGPRARACGPLLTRTRRPTGACRARPARRSRCSRERERERETEWRGHAGWARA